MNSKTYLLISPGFVYTMLAIGLFGCIPIFLNSLFFQHKNCKAAPDRVSEHKVDLREYKRILKLLDRDIQDIYRDMNQAKINRNCH